MSTNVHVCAGRNARAAQLLSELLLSQPHLTLEPCAQCGSGLPVTPPDYVIAPTGLASYQDVEWVTDLRARHPQTRIIVLSLCDESHFREAILDAGADEFILLDEAVPALFMSLRDQGFRPPRRVHQPVRQVASL